MKTWLEFLLRMIAMNDNEIETLMRSLQPRAASPQLESRVERELVLGTRLRVIDGNAAAKRTPVRWWQPVAWAGLGAAAAVLVMSLTPAAPTGGSANQIAATQPVDVSRSQPIPVNSTREWLDAADQGVQFNDQKLPERHLRVVSLERHEWVDPRDGARIAVELPHEDTVVLPVSFQ